MENYNKPQPRLWTGRDDSFEGEGGKRWHQTINMLDLSQPVKLNGGQLHLVFLGFACDEGVKCNQGRTGAKEGPLSARKALANLPWHFDDDLQLWDAGDIVEMNGELEKAQEALSHAVQQLIKAGAIPLLIGGGHEIAFAHYRGIHRAMPHQKIGIVNIDAHFDLRKPDQGLSSGTPFYQIAEMLEADDHPFQYYCLGIQETGNTKILFDRARKLDTKWMKASEIKNGFKENLEEQLNRFVAACDGIYLTTCLDVFDASVAPGVSAPATDGLLPAQVKWIYGQLISSGRVLASDLAELNPSLDIDQRTTRLAAQLIFEQVKLYFYSFKSVNS